MEYLGEDLAPYRRLYEIKTKDDAEVLGASWSTLFKVLNQTPLENLEAALAPMLDVDDMLKFLALEVALVNSDGYWTRASDYNIYQDPTGKFHIVPHDVNEALVRRERVRLRQPRRRRHARSARVGGRPGKPLRSNLLAVPALRARYLGYVHDIAENWLDWKMLEPLVTQYQALIADE